MMVYADVKMQIQQGTTDSFYVFSGEEIEVQNAYINKIAESKNQKIRRVDTVLEATKTKSAGLLGQKTCFVCRDDMDFQKTESVWDKVESLLKGNTLIYIASKLDKRSKFYNTFSEKILNFEPLSEQVLIKHIRENINLSVPHCKELIRVCQSDYGRILTEIDKIYAYGAGLKEVPVDTLQESRYDKFFMDLIDDGTIYQPPEDAIFDWVDAMLSGTPRKAFRLWQECVDIGEPSLKLLLVLYQGVKRLLQVQSCPTTNVAETTGLTQWEINLVKNYQNVYSIGELVAALRNIKALETGIKTGTVDEEFTVPYAMVSLLSE